MEGNGPQKVFLNSDELMTEIVRYLNSENVKFGPRETSSPFQKSAPVIAR